LKANNKDNFLPQDISLINCPEDLAKASLLLVNHYSNIFSNKKALTFYEGLFKICLIYFQK